MLPSPTIPPDPFARSALPFRLACLLARGAPASDIMACGADCWGEARVQIALVDALATAKAWVGCGGHGGQPPLLLGPPGFEARLLGRVAAAAGTVFFGLFREVNDYRFALLYAGFLFLPAAAVAMFLPEPPDGVIQ